MAEGAAVPFFSRLAGARRVGLGIGDLVDAFRRRWLLFVLVAAPITAGIAFVAMRMTPVYWAGAQIKIDTRPNAAPGLDMMALATGGPPDQALIDTEVSLIKSRAAASEVVRQFELAKDPEFAPKKPRSPGLAMEETVNSVLDHLAADRQGTTYVVNVAFRSHEAAKAAALANAFAEQYIRRGVDQMARSATQQSQTIEKRLDDLGQEVKQADERLAQYRASTGLMDSGSAGTITEQQIAPLSSQLATAESDAAAARAAVSAARSQISRGGIDSISGVLSSPVVADLRGKRAEILREQGRVSARYGPQHPDYIRVTQQLADIDRQIADESGRIVSGLQATAQAASARAASLRAELNRLRAEQASNTRAAATADSLKREAEAKSSIYNQTSEAAQRASQQRETVEAQAHLVQPAVVPLAPSAPNKPLFLLLAIFAGGLVGIAVVLVVELMTASIRTVTDIEKGLGIPFLVSLPRIRTRRLKEEAGTEAPWDYLLARPISAYAEALQSIRSTLREQPTEVKTIAICSALPHEGKTTTSVSLARAMALSGDRVLLVDCDLRRNGVGQLVGSREIGLIDVLEGRATLEQAGVEDRVPGLTILPLAGSVFVTKDVLSGAPMEALLADARERFDFVVLDTPPVLAVTSARTVAAMADAAILVVGWGKTPPGAAGAAVTQLERSGARLIGGALSMVHGSAKSLSASDPAYYQRAYASYYQN
jgi:succinoglycan biosynthesis transport protein ExoP